MSRPAAGKAAASRTELQRLLDSEKFLKTWRFRLVKVADGECTVAMPNTPSLERPGGIVNGPALVAAADVAMWLAIKSHLGIEHDALTSDLNTVFLAPAKAKTVYCTARILKAGRKRFFGTADCSDGKGRIFTHHTLTYIRVTH
ncbi:unnamed protein product [Phaeothamnion confervicola]